MTSQCRQNWLHNAFSYKKGVSGSNVLKSGTMVHEYVRFSKMTHLQYKIISKHDM